MKRFFRYLRAQCKRFALAYPKILALIIVTVLCIGAVAAAVFAADDEKSESDALKVRVGIVGNLEDTYLDLAVFALQNMDSSKYYADMVTMELDEAKKSLEKGEIIGYLTVPDGYVESVLNGENELLTYVINDTAATFVPQLMNEVIETVSHYVMRSQSGIYGYTDFSRAHDIPRSEYRPKADDMAFDFLDVILERKAATETEYIGDIGGFDLKVYYICAFFCLILLLWGQSAAPLLIKQEMALPRLLSIRKTGAVTQVLGEFIPFCLLQLFNTFLLFAVLWAAAEFGELTLPLPFGTSLGGVFALFVRIIPVVLVLAAMQFLLYEICTGVISGVLLVLFSTVALSFVTGFFFPVNSLPESVAAFSAYLPTGAAFSYVLELFGGRSGSSELLTVLLFTVILAALSCLVRYRKIRSVGR